MTTRDVRAWVLCILATLSMITATMSVTVPPASAAVDPCGPAGNKISCENSKPGTPRDVWDIDGAGDADIQGFAGDISVNVGQRVDFKIDTTASNYSITIYRTGYYGGDGARQIATVTPSATLPQTQPACITDPATELYDCGNWAVSASWTVPSTAVSGVYVAKLVRADNGDSSHITFIVRDDSSHSDVVFQTSDPTWEAYNTYGGSNFYMGGANGRAYKISYNRPFSTRGAVEGRDFYFSAEYAMVRFLEKNGYDVSYMAGVDSDRYGSLLKNHKTFLSVGHDEYWSGKQRASVEAARDAGVNLMFLSGNEMYWRTRYEPSSDAGHTAYRTLVSYKETWSNAKIDPSPEWTGTWRDPRFASPSNGGGLPENGLTGTAYMSNNSDLPVTVTAEQGKLRLWRNTSLTNMAAGTRTALADHTVGYESDEDLDNGFRPQGLVDLSTTTGAVPQYLYDYGNTVDSGTTTHHITMYRASSGALVFSAGSIQWTWGLDADHDGQGAPADPRMQQAQVNLLADMGAQPTTLDTSLTASAMSTDSTGPTVTIGSPAAGAAQQNGQNVTATGTASDVGGRVAGVEASTDGGKTWHPATGTTSWSYTYVQHGTGATPLMVRAVDDSANIGAAATVSLQVSCPCNVFGNVTPAMPASSDGGGVELGMRFTADTDGFIYGVRFYKGTGNTGTHTGSLWTASGQRLANVTFTNETSTGWQQATFANPVPVTAGTTYVVSYSDPAGHYAYQENAFYYRGIDAAPLQAPGGWGNAPAGVYGGLGTFPNTSFSAANYYVDPVFRTTDESPLSVGNQQPLPGSTSVPADATISGTFSKKMDATTIGFTLTDANGQNVPGATSYDATTRTVTFTPSSALNGFVKYTATLRGTDTTGKTVSSGGTWSWTTAKPPNAPGVCPCGLFDDTTQPQVLNSGEATAVTLGVRFQSTVDGKVDGVRFYKGPDNTGTHVGSLWAADGTKLASATFTNESTSGWQTVMFAQPVSIKANTDYIAAYRTPVGNYAVTPNGLADPILKTPLKTGSGAGAYSYADAFPGNGFPSNYLVDPVFEKNPPTVAITAQDPAPGALDVDRNTSVRVWFSAPLAAGYSMSLSSGGSAISGTTSLSTDGTGLVFKPAAPLPKNAQVTVALRGVTSTEGATLADQSWSFTTVNSDSTGPETLFGDTVPDVQAADDGAAVEVGTVFKPAKDGTVTALRFFKGAGNGGTHTGSLWTGDGQKLAGVTFTNETPNGWQSAKLATPVAVSAGQTYVVSYLAPQGHYSYTSGFFNQAVTNGDLTGPSGNNGVYLYGAAGGFPQYAWGSSAYFVDVAFTPDPPKISVKSQSPAAGATDVSRTSSIKVTFSAPIQPSGYQLSVSQGGSAIAGSTSLSSDGTTLTFTPSSILPGDSDITVALSGVTSVDGATLASTSWTFHTSAYVYSSMFADQLPSTASSGDGSAVELGTTFVPSVDGQVTAIKFYKGAGNGGTHTGSLWTADGQQLATVTFTNETASGWQTAVLSSPVPVTAGTSYVVSYYAPQGNYSLTGAFFASPWAAGRLSAPSPNGWYRYGGGFPTNTYNNTNYYVDVVLRSTS